VGQAIELAWRRGARLDSWREHMHADRWWNALQEVGLCEHQLLHEPFQLTDLLPWDHIRIKAGRPFLEKEQQRATLQLQVMADAT
jgi:hypothetical protein